MKKKTRRLTINVTPQTLYHLETLARRCDCSLGEVVDFLVIEHQTEQHRRNKPKERTGLYHVWK